MNGCVTTRAFAVNLSAVPKVHDVVTFTPQPQGSNAEFVGLRPRGGVDVRVLTTVVRAFKAQQCRKHASQRRSDPPCLLPGLSSHTACV